uniref:LsmAD domain-containing protein n=1 Tax=Heterorhabditis bacteriophora TaxID=37862 RepID=A0A1I7WRH6_HETBA
MHSQNGEHSLFGYGTQLAKEMLNAASANMNKQKRQDTATGRIIKANEVNKAEINDEEIDIGAFKIGKTVSPIETVSFTPTIVDQVKQPFHQPQQSAYTSYHSSLPLSAYQAPFTSAVTVPPFFFPPPPGYKGPLPPAPPPPPGYGAHPLSATLFIETSPPPGYSGPMPPPPPPPFGFVPEGYNGQLPHNSAIYPNVVLNQQPQLIRNQVRLGSALPLLTNMSYYPSISGSGINGPFSAFSTEDTTKTIKSFDHSVRMDKTSQIKEMDAVGVSKEYHDVTNDSVLSQDPAKRTSKGLSGFGGK